MLAGVTLDLAHFFSRDCFFQEKKGFGCKFIICNENLCVVGLSLLEMVSIYFKNHIFPVVNG